MNKENKTQEKGKINFELLESYSPKDFILIKEPPKYPATVPQEKMLFINISTRRTKTFKSEMKIIRKRRISPTALKIKLVSTALATYNRQSDVSVLYKEIEKYKNKAPKGKKSCKRFDYSLILKGAFVFLAVVAFFFTAILLNRLYDSHYEEGIDVWNNTRPSVVEISAEGMISSGVIWKEEGGKTFIITNYHSIYDTSDNEYGTVSAKVYGTNENFIPAEIVDAQRDIDIAVITIPRTGLKKTVFAGGTAQYGQTAYAVGNGLNQGISISKGIVCHPNVLISILSAEDANPFFNGHNAIMFDAAISKGNSGGGLFNKRGELIGIVFGYVADNQSVAYAVPISLLNIFLNSL